MRSFQIWKWPQDPSLPSQNLLQRRVTYLIHVEISVLLGPRPLLCCFELLPPALLARPLRPVLHFGVELVEEGRAALLPGLVFAVDGFGKLEFVVPGHWLRPPLLGDWVFGPGLGPVGQVAAFDQLFLEWGHALLFYAEGLRGVVAGQLFGLELLLALLLATLFKGRSTYISDK